MTDEVVVEGPSRTSSSVSVDSGSAESHVFEAEISQLMNLIINAFYSNKEIFLRELISNASDALDKVRYHILNEEGRVVQSSDLRIRITPDKESNVIIIEDSGLGMNRDELRANLGTIANSGTKQFMENLRQRLNKGGEGGDESAGKDVDLIGQFGVGFYSAYLVANRVSVVTSSYKDDDIWCWESDAGGSYNISKVTESREELGFELAHGTRIILHMKDDSTEYVDEHRIRDIVKKHSQFVNYPIELFTVKTQEVEVDDEDEDEDGEEGSGDPAEGNGDDDDEDGDGADADDGVVIEEVDDDETPKKKKTQKKEVRAWDLMNKDKPVWSRSESEVTKEEYESFYKNISNDHGGVLGYKHFSMEGNMEFKGILYIPKRAPFDMFNKNISDDKTKFKLYAKRVFLMDNCKDLIPEWLRFISGVVDSYDLPLNVSREMLQENSIVKVMRKRIVSKTIDLLKDIYENKEDAETFFSQFSRNLKLGVYEEEKHREKLAQFLMFYTTTSPNSYVRLEDYISRMKEGQKKIYFLAGENKESVEKSVFLEGLRAKGYEVLYMIETIDEYMVQQLKTYKDYEFVSVSQEGLGLEDGNGDGDDVNTSDDTDTQKKDDVDTNDICKLFKEVLGSKVERVVVSKRIVDSPTCLVSSKQGWSANMERIMNAQAFGDNNMYQFMKSKKIMEINPDHKVIRSIYRKYKDNQEDRSMKDSILMIYDMACMSSGFKVENIDTFSRTFYNILNVGLGGLDDLDDGVDVSEGDDVEVSVGDGVDIEASEGVEMEHVD